MRRDLSAIVLGAVALGLCASGAVGVALSGPDTGGSQYFFTLTPQPHLDGHYPLFARVVSGTAVLDALVQGDRIKAITVP